MTSTDSRKRVLITGGAGFIGSHLVDRLLKEGYDVVVMDNMRTGTAENLAVHKNDPRVTFVYHDVKFPFPDTIIHDPTKTGRRFAIIFHLACPASPVHYQADSIGTTMTCVNGTYNVLQLATLHDCPLMLASTSEVYGDPISHPQKEEDWGNVSCNGIRSCYDEGKRCAESLAFDFNRRYGTKIRVVRIFNTYGPRMCFNDGRIISNFVVQALQGKDITIYGTGNQTRSFQYIDDLVEGMWEIVNHPTVLGPINMGNPHEFTVREIAEKVLSLVPGSTSKIVNLPALQDDPKMRKPDITRAKTILSWEPKILLDEGLLKTIEEFKSRMKEESGEAA